MRHTSERNRLRAACLLGLLASLAAFSIGMADSSPPRFLKSGDPQQPQVNWPAIVKPRAGAPNVLLVLTDDVGFGASSTFGGPIPTPTLDQLAHNGLRFNQFHTTALCSPTRGALLTGRNPNRIELGNVVNLATGFEGFTSVIPKSAATVAQLLSNSGYATSMFGKWHLTPEWEQSSAGPFNHWPTGLGFQYFYGFLNADTSQWAPSIVENTKFVEPPYNDPNYFFERDMTDKAIGWLREQRAQTPDRPFFMYYAPGTAHAPHHAPREWIAKFKGRFDHGWDVQRERTFALQKQLGIIPSNTRLTPRPAALPAWNSLTTEQKHVYSRFMEAYAGALSHLDAQVGRILDYLQTSGQLENTLVIFIQGDNGGSAEGGLDGTMFEQSMINVTAEKLSDIARHVDEFGGPTMYNNYPVGWAWAMSTPFQWYKQVASHFGGNRNGMVVSWPARIKDVGGLRSQFHFVTDVAPTILSAAGVESPKIFNGVEQLEMDGLDMTYAFDNRAAPSTRKTQAFSMMQHVAIYNDGWWAGTTPLSMPWQASQRRGANDSDQRQWELYDLSNDFSQSRNLAQKMPDKLEKMESLFWVEAERNQMLPIHNSYGAAQAGRPSWSEGRHEFKYDGSVARIHPDVAPPTIGRSFTITADITVPASSGQGVVVAQGGRFSGFSLYVKDGYPTFHYNAVPPRRSTVSATQKLSSGSHRLSLQLSLDSETPGAGGIATIRVDGIVVGSGRIEATLFRWISHTEGFDVGRDSITPVSDDYQSPSAFDGSINRVTFNLH
jgi:arylsulfatase A-like enzyme